MKLILTFPTNLAVFQRTNENNASISIKGKILFNFSRTPLTIQAKYSEQWITILDNWKNSSFEAKLTIPSGGWYTLQVRVLNKERILALKTLKQIGIGEVFIISGQSNSANHTIA